MFQHFVVVSMAVFQSKLLHNSVFLWKKIGISKTDIGHLPIIELLLSLKKTGPSTNSQGSFIRNNVEKKEDGDKENKEDQEEEPEKSKKSNEFEPDTRTEGRI